MSVSAIGALLVRICTCPSRLVKNIFGMLHVSVLQSSAVRRFSDDELVRRRERVDAGNVDDPVGQVMRFADGERGGEQ